MGQRLFAGVRRRPRYAKTLAVVLAVGGLLAVIPVTVGAAKSSPTSSASAAVHKPKAVTLVAPNGTPLNVVNGNLSFIQGAPVTPMHVQGSFIGSSAGTNYNLLTALPAAATVAISSITATCTGCIFGQSAYDYNWVTIFSSNASDCTTGAAGGTIAQFVVTSAEPTTEFTYPTARLAPIGFTPTGPWCIGVNVVHPSPASGLALFLSMDGSR
jgi:hypothetical protein